MKQEFKKFVNDNVCAANGIQEIEICVPVAVGGFAEVGDIYTGCDGPAEIIPNTNFCSGENDKVARFVIRQRLKVDVPVTFGASVDVGEAAVDFDDAENEPDCSCKCSFNCCNDSDEKNLERIRKRSY
jgi:hypothetical protein